MNRITIALFAFAFVQLVSGQDACQQVLTAFSTDVTCVTALSTLDGDTICTGNCRTLLDTILSDCDNTVSLKTLIFIFRNFNNAFNF